MGVRLLAITPSSVLWRPFEPVQPASCHSIGYRPHEARALHVLVLFVRHMHAFKRLLDLVVLASPAMYCLDSCMLYHY